MKRISLLLLFLLVAGSVSAQKFPERSLVRRGNRAFEQERYESSLERYSKALEATPGSFEAAYDRAGALYRLERYDEAAQVLAPLAADSLLAEPVRAEVFYNLGNVQFQQKKLKEALESYKNSLRLDPSDTEAKYNYAHVKKMLEDQQEQEDQQQQQQQQQQDQQQDQQEQQQEEQEDRQQQPQPNQGGISPEEQERMLEAIQAQEDKTREKLKEQEGVLVRGTKNW